MRWLLSVKRARPFRTWNMCSTVRTRSLQNSPPRFRSELFALQCVARGFAGEIVENAQPARERARKHRFMGVAVEDQHGRAVAFRLCGIQQIVPILKIGGH